MGIMSREEMDKVVDDHFTYEANSSVPGWESSEQCAFALDTDLTANTPMRLTMVSVFVFLASFSLFHVGLGRKWRWPGKLFVVSFVALFATRLLFGP